MQDDKLSREELLAELYELRRRVAESELQEARTRRWVALVQRLNVLKEDLLTHGSLDQKLKRITDGLVEIFGADFARIWITKPGDRCSVDCVHAKVTEGPHVCCQRNRCLHLMASSGRYTHIDGELHRRVPFDCYKIGRIASGAEAKFLTNDVANDQRTHDKGWAKELGLVSFAGYRLLSEDAKPIGVMALFSACPFSPDEATMLEGLANTTSQVVQAAMVDEARRENENRYSRLVESTDTGFVELDASGRVVQANDPYALMAGASKAKEIIGRSVLDWTAPECLIENDAAVQLCLTQGHISDFETTYLRADGSRARILINATTEEGPEGRRTVTLCRNITERKRMETALSESEQMFRLVSEQSLMSVAILQNGVYHYANDAMSTLLEYSVDEILSWGPGEFLAVVHPDDRDLVLQQARMKQEGHPDQMPHYSFRVVTKSGANKWIDIYSKTIQFTGRPANLLTMLDITERRQAEEALHRLNRELRAISICNQVLVRAEDEQTLLNEICRIICDEVGYRLAWVGYAENDDAKTIRPVAWAGFDSGYIADTKLSWADDTERGQGPAGIVIRSGETIYVQDFTTDPRMAPWRESALQRGYHSGIALPLKDESAKVFGVLLIYATESNAITPEEIRLMEELADDLAFGINGLRTRSERKKAEEALDRANQEWERTFNAISDPVMVLDDQHKILRANKAMADALGMTGQELIGKLCFELVHEATEPPVFCPHTQLLTDGKEHSAEVVEPRLGGVYDVRVSPLVGQNGQVIGSVHVTRDITERKRTEEALQKRVIALTQPLDDSAVIGFSDLFSIEDIQRIQDTFAEATGVASIITEPDGTPITQPSNFCRLCKEIIRKTPKGLANCFKSDAVIGRHNPSGPIVQPCLSGGLWDAGASITIGGKHIANWLIGQVRNEIQDEDVMLPYADEIGADPEEFKKALTEVPIMSLDQFEKVARALFSFANELSVKAYQNVQQARSITEQKRTAEALKESEHRYRTLFEESIDGVYSVLRDGEIMDANESFCKLFGYAREEMIGKDIRELYFDPADRPKFQEEIEKEGFVKDYEVKFRKGDGTEIDCLLTSSVYFGRDGSIAGYRGIMRDLTLRKALRKQLLQAQKMEAIGTLAGGMAHDFNNLLQAILGYSDLLIMKKGPGDPDRKKLEVIQHAARDGADLVSRILTFSRRVESRKRPIDLNEEIRKAQKLMRRTVPRMIEIKLVLAEPLAIIDADPAQVEQVMLNLVVNAQHAMPDGGQLLIETENVSVNDEYLRTHLAAKKGKYVLITVSDTGVGMDPTVVERIFEPFFTTKPNGLGTGLGLSMVHGIVTQHGGYIRCYSEPGMGTSFKIYFPVSASELMPDLTLTREMPAFGTETILLVDDDDRVREMSREMIKMGGYRVIVARSGEEALEVYASQREEIALVILDLIMPGMGGNRCLEELLRIDPEVRVLVASGYSSNGLAHDEKGRGAKGFISKPYNAKDILGAIRRVLDRRHL